MSIRPIVATPFVRNAVTGGGCLRELDGVCMLEIVNSEPDAKVGGMSIVTLDNHNFLDVFSEELGLVEFIIFLEPDLLGK